MTARPLADEDLPPDGLAAKQPPIIIGHSLGSTMTQVLLDRGYGAAGVGVASATVKGVRDLPWSTIKSTFSALNPLKRGQAVPLTENEFHYALRTR